MELNRLARASAFAFALVLAAQPALAQRYQDSGGTGVPGFVPITPGVGPLFTSANPGKISGTFSASVSAFAPTPGSGGLAQLLFSDASSHNVALPTGSDFKIENVSANPAYCVASTSGSTAATAVNEYVPPSSTRVFHGVNGGTTYTNIACISPLSTLSITIVGGTGLAVDSGGGGGSSGGGGAVTQASGSVAAGAYSAGAFVSGSFVSGALADGAIVTLGTVGDTVWTSGAGTIDAILKAIAGNQPTDVVQGSSTSGETGTLSMGAAQTTVPTLTSGLSYPLSIDQATGGLRVLCVGSSCSGGGGGSSGSGSTPQTTAGGDINISTAVTTQLVSASGSNLIYVTAYNLVAAGTTNVSFEYGTGSLCGTGTTVIDGPISLTAQSGKQQGSGLGVVLPPVPAGNALCLVNSASVQIGGSLTYTQTNATLTAFGGGGGSTPFVSNGSNISNASVATSTTNAALTGSPSTIVVNNNGTVPLLVKSVSSSGGTVTASTADLIVPANSTFSLGTNGNGFVAYMAVGGTGSVLITQGSGVFTGAGGGGGSGGGSAPVTAAGVTATTAGAVQGVTGGVPVATTTPNPALQTIGGAAPGSAVQVGANASTSTVPLAQSAASVPINMSTATTTQIVAAVTSESIYVTSWDVIANGTTNFTFEYGTGTNCVTGTTALTGPYGFVAQFGVAKGSGLGAVLVVPQSKALCVVNSAAVQVSGSLAYSQF